MPEFDPAVGVTVSVAARGTPPHKLVTIGDSLLQGFQSAAVYRTDVSVPAIVAYELGVLDTFRYPRYGGPGGLPLNVELMLRRLEERYGSRMTPWEIPAALFTLRNFMDEVEDYWERGPGATTPVIGTYNHNLSCYGWDLRDSLEKTAAHCRARIAAPSDNLLDQIVENNGDRAAMHVYPHCARAEIDDAVRCCRSPR